MAKVKIATAWLDSCAGCHMSFLDLDEALIELAGKIELTATPITDLKEFPQVDVGILEGAVGNERDQEVAEKLRACCKILMALGDCACSGGIVSMRNLFAKEAILDRGHRMESSVGLGALSCGDLPSLTKVRPVREVVRVDCYVPGCPPSARVIHYALSELLEGRIPIVPGEMMRFD